MSRLKISYEKEITTNLMSKLSLKNKNDVPKLKNYFKYGFRRRCIRR